MISCDDCGKEFKYPCFLLKHIQRKYPCNPNKNITKNDNDITINDNDETIKDNAKTIEDNDKTIRDNDKIIMSDYVELICKECNKKFKRKTNLKNHKCKGNILQCKICLKFFASRQSRANHNAYVNCFPPCKSIEESQPQIQTQNNITTQQNAETINNINNTYAPVFNISYVKETGSMICDNPELDDNELLCIEGFQKEAIINRRLNNMDYPKLNRLTMNVIEYEEYDEFFKFLFRDDKNRRMHFMTLGKNAGATCCEAFKAGKIEKFEKDQFFNRVMGYICGHLTIMNNKFAPLNQLLFSKKSKRSFENALRTPSEHYQLFIE